MGQSGFMFSDESMDYQNRKYVDMYPTLTKGDYLLAVKPTWSKYAESNPVLKEITLRVASS